MTDLTLKTDRLRLIALDGEGIRLLGDPAGLADRYGVQTLGVWPPELISDHIEEFALGLRTPGFGPWLLVWEDQAIGTAGFGLEDPEDGAMTIGFELVAEAQRKGLGKEAVLALCRWGFENVGVGFIQAFTLPDLVASQKLLTSCGFLPQEDEEAVQEGLLWYCLTRDDLSAKLKE